MSDEFPSKDWKDGVNQQSLELMQHAVDLTDNQDALQAVASLCMAAGRAAGMARLPLSVVLELFMKQYELIQVAKLSPIIQSEGSN